VNPVLSNTARVLVWLIIVAAAYPVRFHAVRAGLDPSWAFALNHARANGLAHGRDVFFTYGPYGWLGLPMDVGSNLVFGVAFQVCLWLIFAGIVAWFAARRPLTNLAVFGAFFFAGHAVFHTFGYAGPDLYTAYLSLLLLGGAALDNPRWRWFYSAALLFAALALLMKFSSGLAALGACVLFAAVQRRAIAFVLTLGPAFVAGGFLAHHLSLTAFMSWLRASFELGSGFASAMSQGNTPGVVPRALLLAALHAALTLWLWRTGRRAAALVALSSFAFIGAEFKHSFVREAGHTQIYFYTFALCWGAVALMAGLSRRVTATAALIAAGVAIWYAGAAAIPRAIRGLPSIVRLNDTRAQLAAESQASLAADRLPAELLARVKNGGVGVVPWEHAYAAANGLRLQLVPVLQTYSAYTAFLDNLNAQWLTERGPDFILLHWEAIDERHPLLDVPATALAMMARYENAGSYGAATLLARRATPRFSHVRFLSETPLTAGEPLRAPDIPHALTARIHVEYTLTGRLLKLLYRIPEVRFLASYDSDNFVSARVPPDVLSNGIAVNYLAGSGPEWPIAPHAGVRFTLAGPGAAYLKRVARVEFLEIPEVKIGSRETAELRISELQQLGDVQSCQIELLNDVDAAGKGEVLDVPSSTGYLRVRGWMVGPLRRPLAGIWIEIDGKRPVRAASQPRPDIAALFNTAHNKQHGFEWHAMAAELGTGDHRIDIIGVDESKTGFYRCAKRSRFRLTIR
jgi:hypothetical protein